MKTEETELGQDTKKAPLFSMQRVWSVGKNILAFFEKIGASLILPISVLPAAGLLLGLGSSQFTWMPIGISSMMKTAGGTIFSIMPLLFAIGITLGFTNRKGTSALAAVVGYYIFLASLGAATAAFSGISIKELVALKQLVKIMGVPTINTGVFGGILIGGMAAVLFNKYNNIKLPTFLAFFGGERFVPIVTVLGAVALGMLMSLIWPSIGFVIHKFSQWAAYENPVVAFSIYGTIERLLLALGLNHIWNAPFFFEAGQYVNPETGQVVTGELARFAAGDPTAGNLAGGYLFKMFGLPAAAIAIWHTSKPENRVKVGGLMFSAAL